jgi:hypothetical protein
VATERPEVERHLVGVSEHDAHALDRNVELVGNDLRERGADALTELDLSGERGDAAIGLEADPLLEPLRIAAVAHQTAVALCTARIARP